MKVVINFFEDGEPSVTFDGEGIRREAEIPEACEEVIEAFLQFQELMEDDKGVALEVLMGKIFEIGQNWPKEVKCSK